MEKKNSVIGKAACMVLAMTLICGVFYTAAITGAAQLLFPDAANGSIIEVNGKKYGSALLAQQFTGGEYLWGRVMKLSVFTDQNGEAKLYSGPSNLSPKSEDYRELIDERVEKILAANPDAEADGIPEDLVTCSGSGLDPEISPAAAQYQVPRIAKAREMSEEDVEAVIEACTTPKVFGIFGETCVNVLKVNLMLDGILK